nr:retrovirus-related Pol polyprotein from transposon TNT 1-94 [Tanacetum cinerariifolium]
MNMLNRNCKTSFAKPEFVKKAQRVNPHLYDICCYNDNLALMLAPESEEVIRLKKESRLKLSDFIRPFDYEKLNNLYDLFVAQREKSSEQRYFSEWSKINHTPINNENSKESFNKQTSLLEKQMDESISYDQKCKSSKELFKIKRSVGTIINGVECCKQTIAKTTYFGHTDPYIQNAIEGNFCLEILRINADLKKFHLCLKEEMVVDLRYFNSLKLKVDYLKSQLETQKTQFLNEIDRLLREYYYVDHINAILGVTPTTSVSRPQLRSNQTKDSVMLNNSQGKKQEVEDHHRNAKFSKNKTSVTACNDSLNAKTTNLIEIILFIIDSGCSKNMTGNLKLLTNFMEKFLGTVKFRNDQFAPILGYGDLVQGTVTIKRVYYVEGLNHNLFFVGQFCDADLEVAFRKSTCYICDLKGNDLLIGSRRTNLYSITLQDTSSPNLICLMAKVTSSQAWLWHRRLSHLNFDTTNVLSKNDIVIGLPKLKFVKDHLYSSYILGLTYGGPKMKHLKFSLISSSLSKEDFMLKDSSPNIHCSNPPHVCKHLMCESRGCILSVVRGQVIHLRIDYNLEKPWIHQKFARAVYVSNHAVKDILREVEFSTCSKADESRCHGTTKLVPRSSLGTYTLNK